MEEDINVLNFRGILLNSLRKVGIRDKPKKFCYRCGKKLFVISEVFSSCKTVHSG